MKKTEQVRLLVEAGNFKSAMKIAKGFRLGISKDQNDIITRAYECMVHPEFYKSIGVNTKKCIDSGIIIMESMFGSRA